ncbi:DUF4148 domain-containing protein [Lampropedia aestuarii]|uniref:DUF4148 domain-containing protein n=1 Tax=Lampropedia aestuarii TaxID=2562762 RepID=UPI002468EEE5|nr:DUF4148 domain-containing protein [Lampropedia aestuarii]MDH5857534.1 DUF4148 domain-containing protein [Lampropedia aestuarii]
MLSKPLYTAMLLLALASASASAQSSNTGLSRAEVQADLLAWQQSGLAALYRQEGGPDMASPEYQQAFERYLQLRPGASYRAQAQAQPKAQAPLTRAQVQADLDNWRKAGMDEFSRSNSTPSFESAEYRQAYEKYLRLTEAQAE